MSRHFNCPSCRRRVSLADISPTVVEVGVPPVWWCHKCRQEAPLDRWGNSSDGIPASSFFYYYGAAKSESFLKKLPRALGRKATFAGSLPVIGSTRRIHQRVQHDPDLGIASYRPVAIYHASERYVLMGRYFVPNSGTATKVVMLLSGSGDVAANYLGKVADRYLKRLNVAVLMVDYRGFGGSDRKTPSEQGLFVDARAMFAYLTEEVEMGGLGWRPNQVVIHGYSLGTGVAAQLAKEKKNCAGLILQCPFRSAESMARETAGAFGAWLGRHGARFDVIDKVGSVNRPVLLLIANQDEGMKSHGDDIALKYSAAPNFTVGRYDGQHEEPHNAFKDGGNKTIPRSTGPGGVVRRAEVRNPKKDEMFLINPNLPAVAGNLKASSGVIGCIGVIQSWFASL
jgi:pimeloyl-ACP methyl ester carboxylesterase